MHTDTHTHNNTNIQTYKETQTHLITNTQSKAAPTGITLFSFEILKPANICTHRHENTYIYKLRQNQKHTKVPVIGRTLFSFASHIQQPVALPPSQPASHRVIWKEHSLQNHLKAIMNRELYSP